MIYLANFSHYEDVRKTSSLAEYQNYSQIPKYGGRGRSRTHQALCQHLTGFEDQAPHRGRRSSIVLKLESAANSPRVGDCTLITLSLREVNTVEELKYFNRQLPANAKRLFEACNA